MRASGVVRTWHAEEGWGVVDSPDTPGGCWVHFSSVLVPGHRVLTVGQEVDVEYEAGRQDGYRFRAVEAWPAGPRPDRRAEAIDSPSAAYDSRVTVTWDDDSDE